MFHLSVVTSEKIILDCKVNSLTAPGAEGYLQILKDHAPIVTLLRPGRLEVVTEENKVLVFAISGGFLEVSSNNATLLADAIEKPEEIDINRAKKAAEMAAERLKAVEPTDIDLPRALNASLRAQNRIKIYEQSREKQKPSY